MGKSRFFFFCLLSSAVLFGCSSVPGPESKYSYANSMELVEAKLIAPNLSASNKPFLSSGLAYFKVYQYEDVCEKRKTIFGEAFKQAKPIGEVYVSKADKIKDGKLPLGLVVIQAGIDVQGIGSSMTCDRYFQFETRKNYKYEIEINESRPLLVSCYISIREKNSEGVSSRGLVDFQTSDNGGFLGLDEDLSPICNGSTDQD